MSEIKVWGGGTSRTMRVHWMLHELELHYERELIGSRTGETRSDEFTYDDFQGRYSGTAILLCVFDSASRLLVNSVDKPLVPSAGDTVVALVQSVSLPAGKGLPAGDARSAGDGEPTETDRES